MFYCILKSRERHVSCKPPVVQRCHFDVHLQINLFKSKQQYKIGLHQTKTMILYKAILIKTTLNTNRRKFITCCFSWRLKTKQKTRIWLIRNLRKKNRKQVETSYQRPEASQSGSRWAEWGARAPWCGHQPHLWGRHAPWLVYSRRGVWLGNITGAFFVFIIWK